MELPNHIVSTTFPRYFFRMHMWNRSNTRSYLAMPSFYSRMYNFKEGIRLVNALISDIFQVVACAMDKGLGDGPFYETT